MAIGDLKGTLTGAANSIGTAMPTTTLTGSGVVAVDDLIYCVVGEQTTNTTTAVTDLTLGNTFTPLTAAVDAGTSTARPFYCRVTVAGTLVAGSLQATANGGTNNGAIAAIIIQGPIDESSPLDANPANITSDITSPFTCPSTGTLGQAKEIVCCFSCSTGSAVWTATSPNLLGAQIATQSVLSVRCGYQLVNSTSAVAPVFAGTNPTDGSLGTASFRVKSSLTQSHFRYRYDRETVDSGGVDWAGAQDVNPQMDWSQPFRLRYALQETNGVPTATNQQVIYYSYNGSPSWVQITPTSSVIKSTSEASIDADETALTVSQLSGTGSFSTGRYDNNGNITTASPVTASGYIEHEFGLQLVTGSLTPGDTIDILVLTSAGTVIDARTQTARITYAVLTISEDMFEGMKDTPLPAHKPEMIGY